MSLTRVILSVTLVLIVLLACFAPREPALAATVPARELLTLAQVAGGQNYTFDRATSEALASVQVPRPAAGATRADLESMLGSAGFALRPVGPPGKEVWLVERRGQG